MGRLSILTGSLTTLQIPTLALRQKSQPVPQDIAPDVLRTLLTEMFACMYQVNGRGLAAPQVGVLWRLFILDMQQPLGALPIVLINPEVLDMDDAIEQGREGCLSIPGYLSLKVPRARKVKMAGYDQRLERITLEVEGEIARGMQHEYDHLDGILYIDRLTSLDDLEPNPDLWLNKANHVMDQLLVEPQQA
ncbi:MAG TPA: peptide deformylase [Herpetosiphonaceae bacterium]